MVSNIFKILEKISTCFICIFMQICIYIYVHTKDVIYLVQLHSIKCVYHIHSSIVLNYGIAQFKLLHSIKCICTYVYHTVALCWTRVYIAQFKLDRTCIWHGSTWYIFILRACKHACARNIDDLKPIIQRSCIHTKHVHDTVVCRCMHAWLESTHQIWIACILVYMQIVSQRQQYKLDEHVHVLMCDSPHSTRCKPC